MYRFLLLFVFVLCGCSTSITTTGSGTEVYEQVKQVLEAHRAREIVDGDLGMKGSTWKYEPARGKFVFQHKPRGKFTAARLIEISIRPWMNDQRSNAQCVYTLGIGLGFLLGGQAPTLAYKKMLQGGCVKHFSKTTVNKSKD